MDGIDNSVHSFMLSELKKFPEIKANVGHGKVAISAGGDVDYRNVQAKITNLTKVEADKLAAALNAHTQDIFQDGKTDPRTQGVNLGVPVVKEKAVGHGKYEVDLGATYVGG